MICFVSQVWVLVCLFVRGSPPIYIYVRTGLTNFSLVGLGAFAVDRSGALLLAADAWSLRSLPSVLLATGCKQRHFEPIFSIPPWELFTNYTLNTKSHCIKLEPLGRGKTETRWIWDSRSCFPIHQQVSASLRCERCHLRLVVRFLYAAKMDHRKTLGISRNFMGKQSAWLCNSCGRRSGSLHGPLICLRLGALSADDWQDGSVMIEFDQICLDEKHQTDLVIMKNMYT